MRPHRWQILDPARRSFESQAFETALRQKIVGQERAIKKMVDVYQIFSAGMCAPGRPVANLLFLGPTGSGKTRIVEAGAEILFGKPDALIKIDCAEYQHSQQICKLIGSPPGYYQHRETPPLLSTEELERYHTEKLKLSFLLFDEIEKADDALWHLLLGILDKAILTLGDNRRVDFSQVVVFMTSNLAGKEISDHLDGTQIGFAPSAVSQDYWDETDKKIYKMAKEAAKRKFSPEFVNRIDKMVVFRPLRPDWLKQILEIELDMVQERVLRSRQERNIIIQVTQSAKTLLLQEGTSIKYGARHLKRTIEQRIVEPLANMFESGQANSGDTIYIDWDEITEKVTFEKESLTATKATKVSANGK